MRVALAVGLLLAAALAVLSLAALAGGSSYDSSLVGATPTDWRSWFWPLA